MNTEGLTTHIRKPEDCKDKQTKAYASDQAMVSIARVFYACGTVLAQCKNRKAQKGTTASSVTQLSPPSVWRIVRREFMLPTMCRHATSRSNPNWTTLACHVSAPRLSNKKRLERSAEIFRRLVADSMWEMKLWLHLQLRPRDYPWSAAQLKFVKRIWKLVQPCR